MFTPNRRAFLNWSACGLGSTAFVHLLQQSTSGAAPVSHFPPKVKRAIQITLVGGLSHLDSFDPKPKLAQLHGQTLKMDAPPDIFFGQVGLLRKADWEFRPRGKSGLMISELFPHIATRADDLTVLRSMVADTANHTPGLFVLNTGFPTNGFPALGGWLSYGLGNIREELPAYVVLPDTRGEANGGASNWSGGFLPATHQGVAFRAGPEPVRDLFPARSIAPSAENAARGFLKQLNEEHLATHGQDADLSARVRSYELAARMQLAVPDLVDLSRETRTQLEAYGVHRPETADMARRCLLARRLLERGVRFVQLYSGGPIAGAPRTSWDAHENVRENHAAEALRIDQPVAALLADLKQRGMLEDTLVLFTTEFGRTPFTQSATGTVGTGRDHNRYGFSVWLAGGGLKPGMTYGSTDDVGWKATEHPITWPDFHATVLRLFGIDHKKLTYYHNGTQRRLTNVHGHA
ncbi:MAG: DUF1501 domain-containing protein, partial [Gemmataceae bacterium]